MRNFILALSFSVLCVSGAAAQKNKFSIGPSAGFGNSTLSNFQDREGHSAGNLGLSLVYSAIEHFGIGADIKYSLEGAERTQMVGATRLEEKYNLNYIRVPLKAIYFFNKFGDRTRPKVSVGPSFGFLVGGDHYALTGAKTEDVSNLVNTFDFGINGSAGLNYRLVRNTWLAVDLNYLHGLTDVEKGTTRETLANRNLSINLGVNFGL